MSNVSDKICSLVLRNITWKIVRLWEYIELNFRDRQVKNDNKVHAQAILNN